MVTEDPWIFWKSSLWECYDVCCSAGLKTTKQQQKLKQIVKLFLTTPSWARYAQVSYQFYFFHSMQGTAVWTANRVPPPTNGCLKPRASLTPQRRAGLERSLISACISFYKAITTGYMWPYAQFKRWISVRLGRIPVSIAWETTGHFSWARLIHPTLSWPGNWGSVQFYLLLWNLYYSLSSTVQSKFVCKQNERENFKKKQKKGAEDNFYFCCSILIK